MIPLLALLMISMVVGHDLLMAADAHQGAGPATAHASAPADGHEHHAGPALETCADLDAVRQAGSLLAGLDGPPAALPSLPFALADAPGFLARWNLAPGDPPDIRRAFLQVFLN
jgi:hypothetical protein